MRDIAIGHHNEHGLCLTLSNEIVENLGCTSEFTPRILVTTDTMQEIKHGVLLTAGLVASRRIDCQSAGKACCGTLIPHLADSTMSYLIYLIKVCTGIAPNQQNAEQVVDVADVINIERIDNLNTVNNHIIGIEFWFQWLCGETPYALVVLYQIYHTRSIKAVATELHLSCRQHVACNLYLLSLRSNQVECNTVVGMNIR